MSERKRAGLIICLVVAVSLIAASVTALLLSDYYRRMQYESLGYFTQEILNKQPEADQSILAILKTYADRHQSTEWPEANILQAYGYQAEHFAAADQKQVMVLAGIGCLAGALLFLIFFWLRRKSVLSQISRLTDYQHRCWASSLMGSIPARSASS